MFGTVAHRPRFAPSMCLICSLVLFIYFFLCCSACVGKTRWSRPELWATREQLLCATTKKPQNKQKKKTLESGSGAFFNWHKQLVTTTHGCSSVSNQTRFQPLFFFLPPWASFLRLSHSVFCSEQEHGVDGRCRDSSPGSAWNPAGAVQISGSACRLYINFIGRLWRLINNVYIPLACAAPPTVLSFLFFLF